MVSSGSSKGIGEGSKLSCTMSSAPGMQKQRGTPFWKLSNKELQDKINKELCFQCDEKFGANHVSRNKQLHMLLMTKEDLTGLVNSQGSVAEQTEKLEEIGQVLQLSLCTMATTKKS